jgi:hypothetical protein
MDAFYTPVQRIPLSAVSERRTMGNVPRYLPYLVHAHRYADAGVPHAHHDGYDDVHVAAREAERRLEDPTVADVMVIAYHERAALLLKGNKWVFDDTLRGLFNHVSFQDLHGVVEVDGVRAALEQAGILHEPLPFPSRNDAELPGSGAAPLVA